MHAKHDTPRNPEHTHRHAYLPIALQKLSIAEQRFRVCRVHLDGAQQIVVDAVAILRYPVHTLVFRLQSFLRNSTRTQDSALTLLLRKLLLTLSYEISVLSHYNFETTSLYI